MEKCVYCNYFVGNTKEHIIPKWFVKQLKVSHPTYNIAPCCVMCNRDKADEIVLPTVSNIHTIFKHMPLYQIYSIAEWLYLNERKIRSTMSTRFNNCVWSDFEECIYLYESGYYDYLIGLYGKNGLIG